MDKVKFTNSSGPSLSGPASRQESQLRPARLREGGVENALNRTLQGGIEFLGALVYR